jgi:hypothetical protein
VPGTTVRRKTRFNPVQAFKEHLALKKEAATIGSRADAQKKRLKEWLPDAPGAYTSETGSVFYDLPETVEVAGEPYKGMELRRSVKSTFNEDTADEILTAKGAAIHRAALSTYVDQEKVLRLVAEGKISEEELDKMFDTTETYAFWPVKGEVL